MLLVPGTIAIHKILLPLFKPIGLADLWTDPLAVPDWFTSRGQPLLIGGGHDMQNMT